MIPHDAAPALEELAAGFPVVGIPGPRQVVGEHLKARYDRARASNLSFWRDRHGHEVDLVLEQAGELQPVEIKAGATLSGDAFKGLERWRELAGDAVTEPQLVYAGGERRSRRGIAIRPWRDLAELG